MTSVPFPLAIGVVLFHFLGTMLAAGQAPIPMIERARLGVDIFFILSGFVLAHVNGDQVRQGRYRHRQFLIARLSRIYPAHLAILVLMAVIAGVATLLRQPFDAQRYDLTRWLADLMMVQALISLSPPSEWNGPWSLSFEWAAYLAFPIFAFVGLRPGRSPWITLAAAIVVFLALEALYRWRFGEVVTHADSLLGVLRIPGEFLFGIGLQQLSLHLSPQRLTSVAASAIMAAKVLAAMQFQIDERLTVLLSGLLVLSLALLSRCGADGLLAQPPAIRAGEASFALYLIHMPMLVLWKNGMGVLTGVDSSYPMALWEAAILLPLSVGAGLLLHAVWEGAARRWLRARLFSPLLSPPSTVTERFS